MKRRSPRRRGDGQQSSRDRRTHRLGCAQFVGGQLEHDLDRNRSTDSGAHGGERHPSTAGLSPIFHDHTRNPLLDVVEPHPLTDLEPPSAHALTLSGSRHADHLPRCRVRGRRSVHGHHASCPISRGSQPRIGAPGTFAIRSWIGSIRRLPTSTSSHPQVRSSSYRGAHRDGGLTGTCRYLYEPRDTEVSDLARQLTGGSPPLSSPGTAGGRIPTVASSAQTRARRLEALADDRFGRPRDSRPDGTPVSGRLLGTPRRGDLRPSRLPEAHPTNSDPPHGAGKGETSRAPAAPPLTSQVSSP